MWRGQQGEKCVLWTQEETELKPRGNLKHDLTPMEKRRRQTSVKKEETANNNFSPKQDSLHEWKASNLLTHDTQWWLVTLRGLQGELQQWRGAAEMKDCTGWWRVLRTQYLHRTESLAKRHLGAGLADLRTHSCCWLHLVSPKWAWISRRCADSCKSSESALNQKVQAHWDYPYSTQKLLPSCWDWMAWIWTLPPHSVYMEADFFPSLFVVVVVVMVLLSIFAFFFLSFFVWSWFYMSVNMILAI